MNVCLAVLLLVGAFAPGQLPREANPTSPNTRVESSTTSDRTVSERRQHALAVADGVAERARALQPRADALILLVQYSDLVWTESPEPARRALVKVVDEVAAAERLSPESLDAIPEDARASIIRRALTVAGRHDVEFLETLLARITAGTESSVQDRDDVERKARLYLDLARLAVRANPARSGDYLVQSFEAGSVTGQLDVLIELEAIDASVARSTFLEALDAVRRAQPPDLNRVSELSSFVLGPDRSVSHVPAGGREYTNVTGTFGRAASDPDLAKTYLEVLLDVSSRVQAVTPVDVYVVLSNYAALYEPLDPDRSQAVASMLATCRPAVTDDVILELDRFRSGPILEATSTTSVGQARDSVRRIGDVRERDRATVRLLLDRVLGYGDARSSSALADGISDALGRRQVQSLIEFVEIGSRCEQDPSFAPDPVSITRLASPVLRALAWTLAGESALTRGDEPLATSHLDSAYREAVRIAQPTDRVLVLFKIASVYAGRELPQSHEVLASRHRRHQSIRSGQPPRSQAQHDRGRALVGGCV